MLTILTTHLSEPFEILLIETLLKTKGNQSKAAIQLGISRGSLRTYMKHFNILDSDFTSFESLLKELNHEQ